MAYTIIHSTKVVDLVHVDDPAVVYDGSEEAWIPAEVADAVGADATRIQARPLNGWERLDCQAKAKPGSTDLADQVPFIKETLRRSLVSIDGDKKRVAEFLKSPAADALLDVFTAINDLGARPTTGQPQAPATGETATNGAD